MCEKKTIGILGGMGPLATADLFQKITLLTEAETDRDHIRVYIDSNANIPDRTATGANSVRMEWYCRPEAGQNRIFRSRRRRIRGNSRWGMTVSS